MEFCYKTASVWQFVGKALFILKILIPVVIIILASIEFAKAALSSDEKAISKASKKLLQRIIIGISIFFIPLIIKLIFSMVSLVSEDIKSDYSNCINCLTSPYNSCDTSYEGNIFKK